MKNTILACIAAFTLVGCANLTIRPMSDYNNGPYYCTKTMNKIIDKGWTNQSAIARTFFPVLIIDWPFDALTDTILLPWDKLWYSHRLNK